jgi:polyhydroxyalkanoate synthase subunit PhaC
VTVSSTDWFRDIERAIADWNKQFAAEIPKSGSPSINDLNGDIEATPSEIVYTKDRVKLLHYTPIAKRSVLVPLLIVCALVNRYYILDLQPNLSVIRRYLERGIDVYIIDWGNPAPSDRYETIGDEVDYIDAMVDVIRKRSGLQKVNLQGYCMGGALSVIYASLHPEKIKSLVVQAAPIDFSKKEAGIFNLWARYIDTDEIVDTFGNVPGSFMNLGFLLVNPVGLMIDKYVKFYERINDKDYTEIFLRVEKWVFDTPDVPGESYRQFLKDLFQKNLLVKGELVVNEVRVSLKQLRAPLLTLIADDDTLVPPSSSALLNELVSSRVKKIMRYPTGHVGLCVSKKAHKEFWPLVADWIAKNSTRNG